MVGEICCVGKCLEFSHSTIKNDERTLLQSKSGVNDEKSNKCRQQKGSSAKQQNA
jgi:hypothetical protein